MADIETPVADAPPATSPTDEVWKPTSFWRTAIDDSKKHVKALLPEWKENVTYRAMQPFGSETDAERVALPEDWTRTKQKQAQLAFQLPKIVALAQRPQDKALAAQATAAVNTVLATECKAHYAIDEALADAINASGLMAIFVEVENIVETQANPLAPSDPTQMGLPGLPAMPETVSRVLARKYHTRRISTPNLLWPVEFTGSRWETSPWLGYRALVPLEVLKKHPRWGEKIRAEKDLKAVDHKIETLASEMSQGLKGTVPCLEVEVIYYQARMFDSDAVHPDHLRTIVFVEGVKEPVEHGDIDEQELVPATPPARNPDGTTVPAQPAYYRGLTTFPIRVETLTYVSDLAVPPSDTRAGRSQVRELMRSRAQMLQQRDSSVPMRWFDVNRVDPLVQEGLQSGTWQGWIPMNGPGDRAIGEVARANYPRENHTFQSIISGDLDRSWALSNNGVGMPNATERSATEINAVQTAGAIRLDYEKTRVNRMVAEIAGVLWSLMQRYLTAPEFVEIVGEDGQKTTQPLSDDVFRAHFKFDFVPDTSDRLDIQTKQANFDKLLNLLGKAEFVNKKRMGEEAFRLHGYDPKEFVLEPQPPPPPPPNVSYRFSGEDLLNPMATAIMLKTQQITPADIDAAALMIADAIQKAKQAMIPPPMAPPASPSAPMSPQPMADPAAPIEPPDNMEPIRKRTDGGTHLI